jgi:hypothetical protein
MSITASAIAIAILLAALLLVRRTQKSISERPAPKRETQPSVRKAEKTKFHAVSIRFGNNACTAAKEIQGERFLASEAPQMPLPDCDMTDCQCRFVHYKDRRTKDDRRNPYSGTMGITTGNLKQEQRTGKDRRESSRDD